MLLGGVTGNPDVIPQNCPFLLGPGLASNTCFPWPTRGRIPNGISIGSAVFAHAQLTVVTNTASQTHRPRYVKARARRTGRIYAVRAIRPKNF